MTQTTAVQTLGSVAQMVASADDFGDALGAIRLVEHAAAAARREVVADARAAGVTWQELGDALGVTRQAAQARFGG